MVCVKDAACTVVRSLVDKSDTGGACCRQQGRALGVDGQHCARPHQLGAVLGPRWLNASSSTGSLAGAVCHLPTNLHRPCSLFVSVKLQLPPVRLLPCSHNDFLPPLCVYGCAGDVWHIALPGCDPSLLYGYRVSGANQAQNNSPASAGHKFDDVSFLAQQQQRIPQHLSPVRLEDLLSCCYSYYILSVSPHPLHCFLAPCIPQHLTIRQAAKAPYVTAPISLQAAESASIHSSARSKPQC